MRRYFTRFHFSYLCLFLPSLLLFSLLNNFLKKRFLYENIIIQFSRKPFVIFFIFLHFLNFLFLFFFFPYECTFAFSSLLFFNFFSFLLPNLENFVVQEFPKFKNNLLKWIKRVRFLSTVFFNLRFQTLFYSLNLNFFRLISSQPWKLIIGQGQNDDRTIKRIDGLSKRNLSHNQTKEFG